MTYLDDEQSVDLGQPIELYEFIAPNRAYRYTGNLENVEFQSNTYTAVPMKRSALEGAAQDEAPAVDIEMPYDLDVIRDFAYGIAPSNLELTIRRYHPNSGPSSAVVYWRGEVASISVDRRTAKVRVPSLMGQKLDKPVPGVYYQTQCNHILYDSRCGVTSALFEISTTVTNVFDNGTGVAVASVGANPDQHFRAGEVIRQSDGERRLIVNQSGATLTLNHPFPELSNGDVVDLRAGCDHSPQTCRDKFSNIQNFGGHPFIPTDNPFITGIS